MSRAPAAVSADVTKEVGRARMWVAQTEDSPTFARDMVVACLTALDAATADAARLREEASAYRDRADKVHDQMVNMLHNLKKGMEAPTGSRLEAFLDEWTDLLEGAAPTPPAVATVDEAAITEATDRAFWKSVEIVPEGPESEYEFRWRKKSDGPAAGWCSGLPPETPAPEGPSEAKGWLSDVLRAARETVDAWPEWKRAEIEAEVQASLDRLAGRGRA